MKNTNESGRSMVEMLGVLAIIGVLSVGGIMGYTTAMRKYQANEIAQAITMTVMAAKSSNLGTGLMSASNFQALTGESALPQGAAYINATVSGTPSKFSGIELTTNSKALCDAVAAIIGTDSNQPMYNTAGCSTANKLTISVSN